MIVENSQVAESTENINMLQTVATVLDLLAMKAKPNPYKTPSNINFRPNPIDAGFLEAVRTNLAARLPGIKIDNNKVLRFALRAAAQVLEMGIEVRVS